jgi:hypothetical protein
MFFISIFSSFIPYLLIAVVYLLGMGMHAFEKKKNISENAVVDNHQIIVEKVSAASSTAFEYTEKEISFQAVFPDLNTSIKPLIITGRGAPDLYASIFYSRIPAGTLFCRPPPSISFC